MPDAEQRRALERFRFGFPLRHAPGDDDGHAPGLRLGDKLLDRGLGGALDRAGVDDPGVGGCGRGGRV